MLVSDSNFRIALEVLDRITAETPTCFPKRQFEGEYKDRHVFTGALEILHHVALNGIQEQQSKLLASRHKIISLNELLAAPACVNEVQGKLGLKLGKASYEIKGYQVALPQNKFEKIIEKITSVARVLVTFFIDLAIGLPIGAGLLATGYVYKKLGKDFNPKDEHVKKDKIAIVASHGSGFNQTEWLPARWYLNTKEYGSFFSVDFDGLVSNDPKKGIDDYAREKLRPEILRIKKLGIERFVFLGHSMGGMVAAYYAEHYAESDGVKVEHVISIATPWQGTPMAREKTKRHLQMSLAGGTADKPTFRRDLIAKALDSETKGIRKYYNIWSTTDYAVPNDSGSLTRDPRRQRKFNYLGHYALVAWPNVLRQVRAWLDPIYK